MVYKEVFFFSILKWKFLFFYFQTSKTYLSTFGYVFDDKIKLRNGEFPASLTDPLEKLKKAIRWFL